MVKYNYHRRTFKMGRRKKEPMDPEKKNIVSELIKTYDIKTVKDIQEALKDLLGEILQDMLEVEMNEHLAMKNILEMMNQITIGTDIRLRKSEILYIR
jgi:transposase, mutator family